VWLRVGVVDEVDATLVSVKARVHQLAVEEGEAELRYRGHRRVHWNVLLDDEAVPLVAPRGALPHKMPRRAVIVEGELGVLDVDEETG